MIPRSKEFDIQFGSLKDGVHEFEFHVNGQFFELHEPVGINGCDVEVKVKLTKSSNMLVLDFSFSGEAVFPCDRCLDDVTLPLEGSHTIYVKFGIEEQDVSEDVIVVSNNAYKINVSQYIYELITLSFPSKKVHEEGKCNSEVIRKLNELRATEDSSDDPRWKALKDINI